MIDLLSEMKFNNYNEFYNKRKTIRIYYAILTKQEKRQYKEYIYGLNWKKEVLDILWCYFNEPKSSPYYIFDFELKDYLIAYNRNRKNIEL